MSVSGTREYVDLYDKIKSQDAMVTKLNTQVTNIKADIVSDITALKALASYSSNLSAGEKSEMDSLNTKHS